MPEFKNEPNIQWNIEANRKQMAAALADVKENRLEKNYYPIICGEEIRACADHIVSHDPAQITRVIGAVGVTPRGMVDVATAHCLKAARSWRELSPQKRADKIFRVADVMRKRRFELASWIIYEVSKSWEEAMGEVEEAIDFVMLYAHAAEELFPKRLQAQVRAEENYLQYVPREGVTGAISTWNFPFSLSVEKIASSLAGGCAVAFKPAEQSPVCGYKVMECFVEAGVPPDLIAYLPGFAETGKELVFSHSVTQLTFTGSRAVGMWIAREAMYAGPLGPRRVNVEMGGNNAMIVCPSAVMDATIRDIVISKWGFSGQKCSALQRLIIVGDKHPEWIARLQEAMSSLQFGHPEDPQYQYGPLIDENAKNRYIKLVNEINNHSLFAMKKLVDNRDGWFVDSAVIADISPQCKAVQEEIFGPTLLVFCVKTLEEAVALANDTQYALTAGIHTERESEVEYFVNNVRAGNKYVNRAIVGSKPGRQPFGGYKFSGFGDKVGTSERILFSMNPESVSINRERHGTILS